MTNLVRVSGAGDDVERAPLPPESDLAGRALTLNSMLSCSSIFSFKQKSIGSIKNWIYRGRPKDPDREGAPHLR
jgi:hypothetical protein